MSPQSEFWLDPALIEQYIDPAKENHPNTGHAYVVERLLAAIKKFA